MRPSGTHPEVIRRPSGELRGAQERCFARLLRHQQVLSEIRGDHGSSWEIMGDQEREITCSAMSKCSRCSRSRWEDERSEAASSISSPRAARAPACKGDRGGRSDMIGDA